MATLRSFPMMLNPKPVNKKPLQAEMPVEKPNFWKQLQQQQVKK